MNECGFSGFRVSKQKMFAEIGYFPFLAGLFYFRNVEFRGKACAYGFSKMTSLLNHTRVARFFLVQTYQSGKNVTNDHKLYQTAINHAKWP
jgi:hypothetical protein